MRAHQLFMLLMVGLMTVGCAVNVDEPVQQIPEPSPQREPAAQPYAGELYLGLDPVMQAIIAQANEGTGEVPPKELAVLPHVPWGK